MSNLKSYQKATRYAELAFRNKSAFQSGRKPKAEDILEMKMIRQELHLEHDEIIKLAAKSVLDVKE